MKLLLSNNGNSCFLPLLSFKPVFFLVYAILHLAMFPTLGGVEYRGNDTDRIALLAIKSQLIDHPGGVLSTWNHSLHHCYWGGVTCGHRHSQKRVTVLNLNSGLLGGNISPFIGNMSFLRQILLYHNGLHGQIPSEIGRLSRLRKLGLTNNSLSGEIPVNLSNCINLRYVYLGVNNLKGNLPIELGTMSKIRELEVGLNNFTGPLFKVITNLTTLEAVYANYNAFSGTIPNIFARMRNLYILSAASNELSGIVPSSLFNHSPLQLLELGFNKLQGNLPLDIILPQIRIINLPTNSFTGPLPITISNLTYLEYIDLSNNNFRIGVWPDFGHLHNLGRLLLSYNNLGGTISFMNSLVNCSQMDRLDLRGNDFTGVLPKSVSNLSSNLEIFLIGQNQITGEIPRGIGNLNNLVLLYMDDNQFTGTIPNDLGKLHKIQDMILTSNRLTGIIPNIFRNLSHFSRLSLARNKLKGNIPSSLGNCRNLLFLDLSYNDLNGTLLKELFGGAAMFVKVDLSHNHLEGFLYFEMIKQINLENLNVSQNKFSGEIPQGLGDCLALQYLNMKGNSFHGSIPPSFISLRSLQTVDLSHNNLSGTIPDYFSGFPLTYLNLSYNSFEGKIPTKGIFANASAISLIGNSKLCGGNPQLGLPKCMEREQVKKRKPHAIIIVIMIICALVILAFAAWLYYTRGRRKTKSESSSSIREAFLKVSYNMLFKATDGFSSENLLGKGTFGSVFKGILEPEAKTVAVKVLNLQARGASKSFMAECKALRNIRHRNLVGVITACSSIDFQGNDFKALVYEFMPNRSLERWLHEDGNLNLFQRVDIATDVASALYYLHHSCEFPVVHCDLKPCNILLDNNMVARVGDFGLAKFVSQHQIQHESSSIGIRGTVGYIAPEYGLGGELSRVGDIYSFGILLLEIMTGKRPTDNLFREDFSLHMCAKTALPDQVLQIMDPVLVKQGSEGTNEREHTQATLQNSVECMTIVVNVGVSCSSQLPEDRMMIAEVLSELRKAREILTSTERRQNLQHGS